MIRTVAMVTLWLFLAAIVVVTLAPINGRPLTGYAPGLERFGAFLLIGFAGGVAYPKIRLRLAFLLVVAAGSLELAQHLSPTRHGRVPDFLLKAVGGLIGMVVAPLVERLALAYRRRARPEIRHDATVLLLIPDPQAGVGSAGAQERSHKQRD